MSRKTIALFFVAALFVAGVAFAAPTIARGIGVFFTSLTSSQDDRVQAHVTIYLEPPILIDGGAVIVVGRQMPDEEWRKLSGGPNPATDDPNNPKRAYVKPGDRLFGAVASSPVTVVEFFYPESGSYTFNFLPAKAYDQRHGSTLRTTRVLSGSGSAITDPETKVEMDWPSVETIAVIGPNRGPDWARAAKISVADTFDKGVVVHHFEGGRTISLTIELINRYVGR